MTSVLFRRGSPALIDRLVSFAPQLRVHTLDDHVANRVGDQPHFQLVEARMDRRLNIRGCVFRRMKGSVPPDGCSGEHGGYLLLSVQERQRPALVNRRCPSTYSTRLEPTFH
jgi:hypothetical protein